MPLKDKVIKIITEAGMSEDMKRFSEKIQKDILAGVGKKMLQEQKEQTKRFLASLANWDKMVQEKLEKKVDEAILKKV